MTLFQNCFSSSRLFAYPYKNFRIILSVSIKSCCTDSIDYFRNIWYLSNSVQLLSRVRFFATPWTAAHQASLAITNPLETTQTHVHWVGDAIQPSHSLSSPFSSCPQSFPASGSFQMSQLFAWGGQSTGVSALASFPPKKSQGWSLLE